MAIYHCSAKSIGRSAGRSATAAAAYRAGKKIEDKRLGLMHDYSRKRDVDHAEVMAPDGAPEWARNRSQLWNEVESTEKRRDAQLARELVVALPRELSRVEKLILVSTFAKTSFSERGIVADLTVHGLSSGNPHAHIMLTTREIEPEGFGRKNRDWGRKETLREWRSEWARHANAALERSGRAARIDHRSLEAQGIGREPGVHLGPRVAAMERRGAGTARGRQWREIQEREAERAEAKVQRPEPEAVDREPAAVHRQESGWERHYLAEKRRYLAVPYAEKDAAREAGARWDREAKSWYAPEGGDLGKLSAWDLVSGKVPDEACRQEMERLNHYLAVPKEEEWAAREAKVCFDREAGSWFVPKCANLDRVRAWDTVGGKGGEAAPEPEKKTGDREPKESENRENRVQDGQAREAAIKTPIETQCAPEAKKTALERISPQEEFRAACLSHGLVIEGGPEMDGQWHRVPVASRWGDGGRDQFGHGLGSYRGYLDGVPSGEIMNLREGGTVKWVGTNRPEAVRSPSFAKGVGSGAGTASESAPEPEEKAPELEPARMEAKAGLKSEEKTGEREPGRAKNEERRIAAAPRSGGRSRFWQRMADRAMGLDRPEVAADPMVRLVRGVSGWLAKAEAGRGRWVERRSQERREREAREKVYYREKEQERMRRTAEKTLRRKMEAVVVPGGAGALAVDPQRELKGNRANLAGPIIVAGKNTIGDDEDMAEIAKNLHEATGRPVAYPPPRCFDLEPVVEALHRKYPAAKIVIATACQLDPQREMADAAGGEVVTPRFTEAERDEGMANFNDLARRHGREAVGECLALALGRSQEETREMRRAEVERQRQEREAELWQRECREREQAAIREQRERLEHERLVEKLRQERQGREATKEKERDSGMEI